MTTIRDISSPEALADLCAMVYEHPAFAIEGKPRCFHDNQLWMPSDESCDEHCTEGDKFYKATYKYIDEEIEPRWLCPECKWGHSMWVCKKCLMDGEPNPDLLCDLNAVHELEGYLWAEDKSIKNAPIRISDYARVLTGIAGGVVDKMDDGDSFEVIQLDSAFFLAHAKAHHRAEAFATLLTVECGECGGRGGHPANDYDSPDTWYLTRCPTCHGTKRVPLIKAWAEKWRGR